MIRTVKSRTRAMLTAWFVAFSFGGSALAQSEGQIDEDANDVSGSASAGVGGALRLSLSADVFSSITTKNDPKGSDPEATVETSNAGLPGASPRLALGYAPNGNINFGARLGFATSSAKVSISWRYWTCPMLRASCCAPATRTTTCASANVGVCLPMSGRGRRRRTTTTPKITEPSRSEAAPDAATKPGGPRVRRLVGAPVRCRVAAALSLHAATQHAAPGGFPRARCYSNARLSI